MVAATDGMGAGGMHLSAEKMRGADADFNGIVLRLKTLPSYHPTVVSLLSVSTEAPSAVEQFEAIFEKDPAFASELLQVANSPEFGLRGSVASVRHALMLLGLDHVNALAFNLAIRFYRDRAPSMRDVHSAWSHSVATAIVAEAVLAASDLKSAGIYTAGLIHDIGRLGMMMTEGDRYVKFASGEFASAADYLTQENEATGIAHTEAGGVLAENWGFPKRLCHSIRRHHDPYQFPLKESVGLVSCACRLASALGYSEIQLQPAETLEEVLDGFPAEMRHRACLEPERLHAAIGKALQGVWGFSK
jgi:putative nucleotidyltransferase with HDIG domain